MEDHPQLSLSLEPPLISHTDHTQITPTKRSHLHTTDITNNTALDEPPIVSLQNLSGENSEISRESSTTTTSGRSAPSLPHLRENSSTASVRGAYSVADSSDDDSQRSQHVDTNVWSCNPNQLTLLEDHKLLTTKKEKDTDEDDIPRQPVYPKDSSFYGCCLMISHSQHFVRIMLLIVISDAACVAMINDLNMPRELSDSFLAFYTLEFLVKIYSDRIRYWYSLYNLFDFSILTIAYLDFCIVQFSPGYGERYTNLTRSLRAFRALKVINFLPGVQVIATAIFKTLRQLISDVILLIILLIYVFGVMGFYFFGYHAVVDNVIEAWGTLASTFLTLFTIMTADSWWHFLLDLIDGGNSAQLSYCFILIFLFIGHFIIVNLFVAVIITNIQSSSDDYKMREDVQREIQVTARKKKYWKRSRNEVKNMISRAALDGESNFTKIATDYYRSLRKYDFVVMSDLKSNVLWIDTFSRNMKRSLRYSRLLLYQHRDMLASVAPLCNLVEVDSRKSSVSQSMRYVIEHKEGLGHLLSTLSPNNSGSSGGRKSVSMQGGLTKSSETRRSFMNR